MHSEHIRGGHTTSTPNGLGHVAPGEANAVLLLMPHDDVPESRGPDNKAEPPNDHPPRAARQRKEPLGRRLGDVKIVAEKLGCSTRHVYRLADAGRMPAPVKLGALVRWDLDAIDQWIASGCPSSRQRTRR